jgi:hypothetical protein
MYRVEQTAWHGMRRGGRHPFSVTMEAGAKRDHITLIVGLLDELRPIASTRR